MWPFAKKKEPGAVEYGEITTRLTAFTFDLVILFYPVYYLTTIIVAMYYPEGSIMTQLNAKVTAEHPELANDSASMMQYIILKYPNEMKRALEHLFFGCMVQYLLVGLYVIPMTYKYGATLGKMIVGIKVIDLITGNKPTLSQSIIRYIGYLFSVVPLGLGIIWGSFQARKRCWHDYFGDSLVVYDSKRWYKKYLDRLKAYFNLK
jgi:uncharacterized RDD family membrane protein YckC